MIVSEKGEPLMNEETLKKGLLFDEELMHEIRLRFERLDEDADGSRRLFFENAGGSLRLKSVVDITTELNKYPDCFARDHKSSKVLHSYEVNGREDFRRLVNAKGGAVVTALTASAVMFKIVEPMIEHSKGTNIVTTILEHPSAVDSCRYFGQKYGKEVRIAPSDPVTGGIKAEDVLALVDENTALINVIAASNMTGAMTDLKTIATEAKKISPDVFIVSDAVQHAPHGVIDVQDIPLDGVNIAPYKFFGTRGLGIAYISDRVKDLPHARVLDDETDFWELGSVVPAQYASLTAMVDYLAWLGSRFIDSDDRRKLLEEGINRIHLQEQALLYRMLYGKDGHSGLLSMEGVDTFFDYSDLANRDLILAMKLNNLGYYETVREYEKRGIIVYERVASSYYSKPQVESFGLDGIIRVSPLHCNTVEEIDEFLEVTKELLTL